MASGWWWALPIGGAVGLAGALLVRRDLAAPVSNGGIPGPTAPVRTAPSAPGPSGSVSSSGPCDPMTMHCLLAYSVGRLPVPDALGWIPAQNAARLVQASGHSIPQLVHEPIGHYGSKEEPAQQAAQYLIDIGVDPAPQFIYAALAAASRRVGVPLPLLLAVAYGESRYLDYGTRPNQSLVSPYGDVGLMQVGQTAVTQIDRSYHAGLTWAAVQTNVAANALAGAYVLRYFASQRGLNYRSVDYAAWQPIVAEGYGEGTAALLTIRNAQSTHWTALQDPKVVRTMQAARITTVKAPRVTVPAVVRPKTVQCRVIRMYVGSVRRVAMVRVCSDGQWTVE